MATPMREVIGRTSPRRLYEFGDQIAKKLTDENQAKQAERERSGLISGGKLAQPTLWAVLDILGVDKEFSPYLLGKFRRGNDVEDRAIEFLTGIDAPKTPNDAPVIVTEDSGVSRPILAGKFWLQHKSGYRGGVGFVDMAQANDASLDTPNIYHEVKSSTKMSYDRVAAAGRYKGEVNVEKGIGVPYYHHAVQLAYYCLGDNVNTAFLHYFNADDYRLTTFSINPLDYKEEIDKEIDDIQAVFLTKQLPPFEGFLDWHKQYKKDTYGEWNDLTPDQMMQKLQMQYPKAYEKLMTTTLPQ